MSTVTADTLLQSLLRGRRIEIKIGRFKFFYERPPEMELQRLAQGGTVRLDLDLVQRKCVGWEGVKESDVVGADGATDQDAPFSTALFSQWIADREDLWGEIAQQLANRIEENRKRVEALKGN